MTVVVTGAAGFIGRNLVSKLSKEGYEVIAIDKELIEDKTKSVVWHRCDVTKPGKLSKFFDTNVETVYHLAGVVGVRNYLISPRDVINVNFESTKYIVEFAKKFDFKILFTSTSEVYGKNSKIPWSEESDRVLGSTRKMRWIYSTAKSLSEHLIFAESENSGIKSVLVRLFNVYGRYQLPVNVVPRMIASLILTNKLTIYDKGLQTRCFTYVDDAIDAMLELTKRNINNDVFNIGSDRETSVKELAQIIVDKYGKKNVIIDHVDSAKFLGESFEDIERRVPDVSKIRQKIGWKSTTSLEDGIKETVKWYLENENWWKPRY